jgi:hypothetical protein
VQYSISCHQSRHIAKTFINIHRNYKQKIQHLHETNVSQLLVLLPGIDPSSKSEAATVIPITWQFVFHNFCTSKAMTSVTIHKVCHMCWTQCKEHWVLKRCRCMSTSVCVLYTVKLQVSYCFTFDEPVHLWALFICHIYSELFNLICHYWHFCYKSIVIWDFHSYQWMTTLLKGLNMF